MAADSSIQLAVISDIHYAGTAERQRHGFAFQGIHSPVGLALNRAYRRFVWLRDPFAHNPLLDEFLRRAAAADFVVANGDYSCDSAFVGVSDDAACASARECLQKLRDRFGARFQPNVGDHELGKASMGGGLGGPRVASFHRMQNELGLRPVWQVILGNYALVGLTSTLVALPVFEPEMLPAERAEWQRLREFHLAEIRRVFAALRPEQRVLLFCHDPTALPFLWREEAVRAKLAQIEFTIIGHLHSNVVLLKSRLLAGMPVIRFLGTTARRLSTALNEARHWQPFKVRLCPSLAGIELLKDGGYAVLELDPQAKRPARFEVRRISR
jgi:hypothetical protein